MNKRFNLPYTAQDTFPLFPTPGSLRRPESIAGSISSAYSNPSISTESSSTSTSRNTIKTLKKMFRRLFKPKTLDFETAMWEIFNLIINPRKMYRSQYYYKQYQTNGKNNYARDDPSFLILLTIFLSISAIAWGVTYSPHVVDILKLILYMVIVDFYATGVVISTVSWLLANKVFNNTWGISSSSKYNINYIEWGFCFDVHCNSFLVIWCLLYLVQFIILPIITIKNSFFSLLLGNSLYFGSIGYYFIITFYGYNSLPFLNTHSINSPSNDNPAKFLQMALVMGILPVLAILWFLTLCLKINVTNIMIDTYFN